MHPKTTLVTIMLVAATAAAIANPAQAAGSVKCDEAAGFGAERTACKLVCTQNDTVSAEVVMDNGDDARELTAGVDCGSAYDENTCNDRYSCSASDDNEDSGVKHGICWGTGDEEWNDYYSLDLWCSSTGGETFLVQSLLEGSQSSTTVLTCASVEAALAGAETLVTGFVHASVTVVGGVPVASGFAWHGASCLEFTPFFNVSDGVITIIA